MRHSAGRSSCSTAERTDDSSTHHLDWCIAAGKEALERGCHLLYQHLPAIGVLDAPLAKGVDPPRLPRSVHEVECPLHAGDVIEVDGQRIVTGQTQCRGVDRDVDLG